MINSELEAALIGAVVATLGSSIFVLIQDWRKNRSESGAVATLLLVELMAQAEFVSVLSQAAHTKNDLALRETFVRFAPPEPVVYRALADKIGLLDARTSSAIVAFHGAISWAKTIIEALPDTRGYAEMKGGPHGAPTMPEFYSASNAEKLLEAQAAGLMERLQQATRGASFNAILAIRALDEIAPHKRLPNDEAILADTLRKLEKAASQQG